MGKLILNIHFKDIEYFRNPKLYNTAPQRFEDYLFGNDAELQTISILWF